MGPPRNPGHVLQMSLIEKCANETKVLAPLVLDSSGLRTVKQKAPLNLLQSAGVA